MTSLKRINFHQHNLFIRDKKRINHSIFFFHTVKCHYEEFNNDRDRIHYHIIE